ncbi:hypothetical protein [Chryseobacterium camelliae]|uniref:hypothetical protein n=1 Tax=Chryseobacterium camelliae TaxID=1265445 RepID=UPI000C1CB931|nr:hypothetical protein [Chryseobacterium camelliae]
MDIPKKKISKDQKENTANQQISEVDSEIYDFLDSELEKGNPNGFSSGFSKNIIRKIETKQQRKLNIKMYTLISILVLISISLLISFLNTEFISMLCTVFLHYRFLSIFFLVTVVLIQFGERLINARKGIN